MSHGQPRAPVLGRDGRAGQQSSLVGPPELLLATGLLPAARWVCRQIAACQPGKCPGSSAAREFAGQILQGWGLPALAEDASVIVSELVTNALKHGNRGAGATARNRVELILWHRPDEVICAVTDSGAEPPVLGQPDPLAEAGRGLHVVQALSATWGWTRLTDRRKAVWAALPVPDHGCGRGRRRLA
jgi:anti-sigma regulatory factor (Ser/Thr protein kinase)